VKLRGAYKGTRRRRELPIVASCVCGWRSRPYTPKKTEQRYQAHIAVRDARQNPAVNAERSKALLLPARAKIVDGARSVTRCVGAAKAMPVRQNQMF